MNMNPATGLTATGKGEYMRADQVAQWLGLSQRTIANWKKARVIPFIRVGRVILFKRIDVELALNRFRVEAVGDRSAGKAKAQGRFGRVDTPPSKSPRNTSSVAPPQPPSTWPAPTASIAIETESGVGSRNRELGRRLGRT